MVLKKLRETGGYSGDGATIRLSDNMWRHIVAEFTAKDHCVEQLYGIKKESSEYRKAMIRFCRTLGKALARVEGAFFSAGILRLDSNLPGAAVVTARNSLGMLRIVGDASTKSC